MKTKVLFWTDSFPPFIGGVEVLAAQYLREFKEREYDFTIVTRYEGEELVERTDFEGTPVYRLNIRAALTSGNPRQLLDLRRTVTEIVRDFQPHLLHIYHVGMGAMLFEGVRQIPRLMTLHAHIQEPHLQPRAALRTLLDSVDYVTCCSNSVCDALQQNAPSFRGRSSAILNALHVPELVPGEISFDPPRILAIGRLIEAKGFDTAIEALAQLLPRFPNLRMTIAGQGPAFEDLTEQINSRGLGQHIDMPGWVAPEAVAALIDHHTLTIMPSRNREPFGLVALQTAQMARPIVASKIGGLPEVVHDGVTGLLVPENDATAFAAAIESLLTNPEQARIMGLAARQHALEHFTWNAHIDAYDRLMQQLIDGHYQAREASQTA